MNINKYIKMNNYYLMIIKGREDNKRNSKIFIKNAKFLYEPKALKIIVNYYNN